MKKNSKHRNGYSKKELIEIIKEIDADRNQMEIQTEKPDSSGNYSNAAWNMVRADK